MSKKILLAILLSLLLNAGIPAIRILYPNGGETLQMGSQVQILWQAEGIQGRLAILLFKNGEQLAAIAESVDNSGTFLWKIPFSLPESPGYRIRIRAIADLSLNDFSDRDFSIKK